MKNIDAEFAITVTHFPNGDKNGTCILFLENGCITRQYFGPTILAEGTRERGDTVKFTFSDGLLTLDPERYHESFGCGYSGSSYNQVIPEYRRKQVKEWIDKHYPLEVTPEEKD